MDKKSGIRIDGFKQAMELLKNLDEKTRSRILTEMQQKDPTLATHLAKSVAKNLFSFAELQELSDRSLQSLLRKVPQEKLVLALRGATPEMKDKVFKNLSARMSAVIKEELMALGPQKRAEVEKAQQEVLEFADKMGLKVEKMTKE